MEELDDFNFLDHQEDKDANSLAWFREPLSQKGMVLSENHFSFPPERADFMAFKIKVSPDFNQLIIDRMFYIFTDPTTTIPIIPLPETFCAQNMDCQVMQTTEIQISDNECDVDTPSYDIRCNRKNAYKKGQKDFLDVIKKTDIDPNSYFRENKKVLCEKLIVETDTPNKFLSKTFCNTSIPTRGTVMNTPVSGVKVLPKSINDSLGSPFNSPEHSTPKCSDASINSPWTPAPWIESTILSGFIFYVDIQDEEHKVDGSRKKLKALGTSEKLKSLSAMAKLKSLGATVKKYFTKNVTHVLFRNGRISTYQKAKKLGIPLVSVLWLLECDRIQGIADPKEFPPLNVEKYENFKPDVQKWVSKYDYLLKPGSIIDLNLKMLNGEIPIDIDAITDKRYKRKPRKAATEVKRPSKEHQMNASNERICSKKLFDDCEMKENIENVHKVEKNIDTNFNKVNEIDSHSTDDSTEIKLAAAIRRKSAPGKLLSKKRARQADIRIFSMNKKDMEPTEDRIKPLRQHFENLTTKDVNSYKQIEVPETGKRKLFDPSDIFITSQTSDNLSALDRECTGPDSVNYPATPIRPKTNATYSSKSRKLFKQKKKLMIDNHDDGSPSLEHLFIDRSPESVQMKKIKPPNIVFTSVPKEDISPYVDMVNSLGKFKVCGGVNKRTTHVVCNGPRRTLNLIKGIARGCWLVDLKWLTESSRCGKWLPEEDYDLSSHFPAAADCCKERRGLKTPRVIDIFKTVGVIYISRNSIPATKDLEEIVRICCGKLSSDPKSADIQVGGKNDPLTSEVVVSEKWLIDSVVKNCLLPIEDYLEI